MPAGATQVEVTLDTGRIHGWVQLGNSIDLTSYSTAPYQAQRTTYRLAGQTIAVQVEGDPDGNNGLYYLHSDHLGSASSMSDTAGERVGEITRYTPFGETRTSHGNEAVTDMGFTGHKHNDSIGLIYMNARFYVPSIGRFASADTIVPDPTDPQAYNRYSYVINNPLKYIDPSGHCNIDPYDDYHDYECVVESNEIANQYGIDREFLAEYWLLGAVGNSDLLAEIWQKIVENSAYLNKEGEYLGNEFTNPQNIQELMDMISFTRTMGPIATQLTELHGNFTDCHVIAASACGMDPNSYGDTIRAHIRNEEIAGTPIGLNTINEDTDIVVAYLITQPEVVFDGNLAIDNMSTVEPELLHSAFMVSYNPSNPAQSIVGQVDGNYDDSKIFMAHLESVSYFQMSPAYIGIDTDVLP